MDEWPDVEIRRSAGEPPPRDEPPRRPAAWFALAGLIVAGGAALYFALRPEPLPPSGPSTRPAVTAAAPPARSLGGEPEPVVLPPLDQSDPLVRSLLGALSSAPPVAAWLATNNLIRNFTVVVANIADGGAPGRQVAVLRPRSGFQALERNGTFYVDPRGYARYDGLADAVASIDPAGAARLYATLKPRLIDAYRELGSPDPSFDHALERAIVMILRTPIVEEPIALRPKGIGFAYADDRLENLTAAQKQLLRMGPRNGRLIEERIRAIALALGVAPDELPAR